MTEPRVSLVLCVKDGMPYLPQAIASIKAQSYPNYEVVVQDGGSTDGSLEFLDRVKDLPIRLRTEVDHGIGQAFNRALKRCSGEFVGIIDSDNLLDKHALATAVRVFDRHDKLAAIYGASKIIDEAGRLLNIFQPEEFDLLRLLRCELVPPAGQAFFSKETCGDELRANENLKYCADLDLWLRLSHLPIKRLPIVLGSTRFSKRSNSRNASLYDGFCQEKIDILERFLGRFGQNIIIENVLRTSKAGVYAWAAESIYGIEGRSDRFERFVNMAEALEPNTERLRKRKELARIIISRLRGFLARAGLKTHLRLYW